MGPYLQGTPHLNLQNPQKPLPRVLKVPAERSQPCTVDQDRSVRNSAGLSGLPFTTSVAERNVLRWMRLLLSASQCAIINVASPHSQKRHTSTRHWNAGLNHPGRHAALSPSRSDAAQTVDKGLVVIRLVTSGGGIVRTQGAISLSSSALCNRTEQRWRTISNARASRLAHAWQITTSELPSAIAAQDQVERPRQLVSAVRLVEHWKLAMTDDLPLVEVRNVAGGQQNLQAGTNPPRFGSKL